MEEVEATLPGEIKEMEREITDAEAIKELEKKPQGSEVQWNLVEAALQGQIEKPGHKLKEKEIDNESLEGILNVRIEQLEKKLQKTVAEKEQLKTALQEKDMDFTILEFKCRELRELIQERDSEKKKLESSLREEKKFYDMHLQTNKKIQDSLYSMYKIQRKELQENNEAIAELEASLHRQYEELCVVRRERESLNRRIQELENERQIKELNNKEVESSVCSKVKKLAAVSVAVGVVAAAGWWFFHK